MKKSFVYLVIALMLATLLCACGMNADDGVIGASPRPDNTNSPISSTIPDVSPTIIPDAKNKIDDAVTSSNPQVGVSDEAKVSPKVGENKLR